MAEVSVLDSRRKTVTGFSWRYISSTRARRYDASSSRSVTGYEASTAAAETAGMKLSEPSMWSRPPRRLSDSSAPPLEGRVDLPEDLRHAVARDEVIAPAPLEAGRIGP